MAYLNNFSLLILPFTLLILQTEEASVPVIWTTSTFFHSGQIAIQLTSSNTLTSTTHTYASPLTGPPAKIPSLAITDINYNFTTPILYMRIFPQTWTQTSLTVGATITFTGTYNMKVYFLAPDPTMTYQYSSFSYNRVSLYFISQSDSGVGPFLLNYVFPISGLTNPTIGLDMTHDVTMLPFINFFNLSSTSYCYQLIIRTRVYDAKRYEANVSSNCPGMTMSFFGWSRIIFDKTLIQSYGYCFFQYGNFQGFNNDPSTLTTTLSHLVTGNFIMGVSQFRVSSPTLPLILSFNTTLANTIVVTPNTAFQRLAFTYWSLKYRSCPAGYPIFHLETETCHNLCQDGTYYNPTTQMCINCFYTCDTCTSYPACTGCDAGQNRHLNGTACLPDAGYWDNGTAYSPPCSSNCLDCTNDTICLACDTGYTINGSTCVSICMQGCIVCPNMLTCTNCDQSAGYYLDGTNCSYCNSSLNHFIDPATDQCLPCNLTQCIQCLTLTACDICNTSANYGLQNQQCIYCNNSENNFINNSTSFCQHCTLLGCIDCLDLSSCQVCNGTAGYYLVNANWIIDVGNQTCTLCNITGCLLCRSLLECDVCDVWGNWVPVGLVCGYCNNTDNYFVNGTQCQLCTIPGCITCSSLSSCLQCNYLTDTYIPSGPICSYCNSSLDNFINTTTQCQPCSLLACTNCQSLSICLSCNTSQNYYLPISGTTCSYCNNSLDYFINVTTQYCQLCDLEYCLKCEDLVECAVCNVTASYYKNGMLCQYCNSTENRFINMTTLMCQQCVLLGCVTCVSLTVCQYCDLLQNYYLTPPSCSYCNNTLNFFINFNTSLCQPCTLSNCLTCLDLESCSICNTTTQHFLNTSLLCQPCQLEGCLQCGSLERCLVCDQGSGYSLGDDGLCSMCKKCKCYVGEGMAMEMVPDLEYSQVQCGSFESRKAVLMGVIGTVATVLILASVTTCLIGIQLVGVIQLAYLDLADNEYIHLYLSPIQSWHYVNGFNIRPSSPSPNLPASVTALGYTDNFLENINVMFATMIFSTLVLLVCQLVFNNFLNFGSRFPKVRTFCREFFMSCYLFNCINVGFCLGLQYKYYNGDVGLNLETFSIGCAVLTPILYLATIGWMVFSNRLKCGQYTQRFKPSFMTQVYIPITIIYRLALGIHISTNNQNDYSTLFILAGSLSFLLYTLINLPYKKFYHNYRSNICHVSQLIILLITNYYRTLKKNVPIGVKARINQPANIELACIVVCVVVGLANTFYEGYLRIKECFVKKGKKVGNQDGSDEIENENGDNGGRFEITQENLSVGNQSYVNALGNENGKGHGRKMSKDLKNRLSQYPMLE